MVCVNGDVEGPSVASLPGRWHDAQHLVCIPAITVKWQVLYCALFIGNKMGIATIENRMVAPPEMK